MALLIQTPDWHKANLVQASKLRYGEQPRLGNHSVPGMTSVKNQVVKEYAIDHMKNYKI